MKFKFEIGELVKLADKPENYLFKINDRHHSNWSGFNHYSISYYGSDTNYDRYEEDIIPLFNPNDLLKNIL